MYVQLAWNDSTFVKYVQNPTSQIMMQSSKKSCNGTVMEHMFCNDVPIDNICYICEFMQIIDKKNKLKWNLFLTC